MRMSQIAILGIAQKSPKVFGKSHINFACVVRAFSGRITKYKKERDREAGKSISPKIQGKTRGSNFYAK